MAETTENNTTDASSKMKKNIMTLQFDLDELQKASSCEVPDNQKVWTNQNEMSPEYQNLLGILNILALYVAKACNDGPEVRDNSTKRLVTVKTFLSMMFDNLNLNGYNMYGLLTELLYDRYMAISGKQQTISLLKRIQNRAERLGSAKAKSYTS
jgi:hypothetical protein